MVTPTYAFRGRELRVPMGRSRAQRDWVSLLTSCESCRSHFGDDWPLWAQWLGAAIRHHKRHEEVRFMASFVEVPCDCEAPCGFVHYRRA